MTIPAVTPPFYELLVKVYRTQAKVKVVQCYQDDTHLWRYSSQNPYLWSETKNHISQRRAACHARGRRPQVIPTAAASSKIGLSYFAVKVSKLCYLAPFERKMYPTLKIFQHKANIIVFTILHTIEWNIYHLSCAVNSAYLTMLFILQLLAVCIHWRINNS